MTGTLDASAVRDMMRAVAQSLIDQTDVLTNADLTIGDGDHGVGMRRGFEAALIALEAEEAASAEGAFKAVGTAILSNTGGAAGAVFGTLFRAGSKAFAASGVIDDASFATALEEGLAAVLKRGGVTEGQKTMVDALAPASRAARAAVGQGLAAVTAAATQGALDGVEASKAMIATTGKARSLGERSIGHPDPGAISVSLILKAMQDFTAGA
ncbi:dihydroxyacetone kinase subunit DhaL [Mesorhizobium sp. ES1-1]|uniref:dihydroxyacetone kinase subunit DhaL n=1 Tax=Mesorhizobium sp. ES1-1 TaxID=2876629 RepID=UPI001CC92DC2|nr:dihydroxyacetone kinase subunit DhaL [Mesorhizobium sp. ES1-1]MBZ9676285.1 dihydroxyacetone kinase subunit L [Mesorhizobium sp. ES1-1]